MNKQILLTGATGFLGSNLLKKLIKENCSVIILKRSFSKIDRIRDCLDKIQSYDIDKTDLETIFRQNKIDVIIHCATSYGRNNQDTVNLLKANLLFPLELLILGKQYGISSFINTDTILDKRINDYSLSKKQFKDWLRVYSANFICINIALEHFYGPFDDKSKFVSYIIDAMQNRLPKIDLTEGLQERDFIYIDDVVDAFKKIINNVHNSKLDFVEYEIGTNTSIKIRDLVLLIKKLFSNTETQLNFGAIPYRKNEIMAPNIDTSAIRKIGWVPKHSIEDGLVKTIEIERNGKK